MKTPTDFTTEIIRKISGTPSYDPPAENITLIGELQKVLALVNDTPPAQVILKDCTFELIGTRDSLELRMKDQYGDQWEVLRIDEGGEMYRVPNIPNGQAGDRHFLDLDDTGRIEDCT